MMKGLIKLIPKHFSYSLMRHWGPITMMRVMDKIVARVVADKFTLILNKVLNPHEHSFIKGRSIYDKSLVAMVGIDCAQMSRQECILLQLALDKAYDCIG